MFEVENIIRKNNKTDNEQKTIIVKKPNKIIRRIESFITNYLRNSEHYSQC